MINTLQSSCIVSLFIYIYQMDLIGNGGWGCEFLLWFMDWFNLLLLLLFLSFVLEV